MKARLLIFVVLFAVLVPTAHAAPVPCFGCPTIQDSIEDAKAQQESDAPAPQAESSDKPVDSRSRSQNFLTGEIKPGQFDPSEHNLWYVERDEKINIPAFKDPHVPNFSDMLWGQTSDWLFTAYKAIITTTIAIVGGLVFGFMIPRILLEPALRLAHQFQVHVTEPFGLAALAIALTAGYAAYLMFAKRKPGRALMEYWMSASVLALSILFVPLPMIRYLISLVCGGATVVLLAGSGQDPTGVAAPSTGPVDTTAVVNAYNQFVGNLNSIMIGTTTEVLTFGKKLPPECMHAYRQGMEQHLGTSDPDNFKYLAEIEKCQPYVNAALQPDAFRAFASFGLLLYAFVFSAAYLYLSWPAVRGQVQLMFFAAAHKFLFIGAALPGPARATAVHWLIRIGLGLAALVILSIYLALMLALMTAVFGATGSLPMSWRLIAALLIPIALCALKWKHKRAEKSVSENLTKEITRSESNRESTFKAKAGRMVERAQSRAIEVGAGAAAGGAGVVMAGAANRIRRNDQLPDQDESKQEKTPEAVKGEVETPKQPEKLDKAPTEKAPERRIVPGQAVGSVRRELEAARSRPVERVEPIERTPPIETPTTSPAFAPKDGLSTLHQDLADERARRAMQPVERPQDPVAK